MKSVDKVKLLKKLEKYVRYSRKLCDNLTEIGFGCDGKTMIALDELCTQAVGIASVAVGDKGKWVDWMVWENEFGKKDLEVQGPSGDKWRVKTWKELVDIMEDV